MAKKTKQEAAPEQKAKGGEWFNNIARLIKSKRGTYFVAFERGKDKDGNYRGESPFPLTINEGDIFPAKLKRDQLQRLVDSGQMSEEIAEKICQTVKFEIDIPPRDGAKASSKNIDQDKDEVDF